MRLPALNGPVEVLRDRWGVPHIYAASSGDLLFAQGFVHAQDRLWQMDFQRRVVRGRLAEVFGPTVLDTDRSMRILGMYRVAEAEVALLSPESRADLEAYAAGVNAAMSAQPLPVEFTLLRYRPGPWTPADCLCWAKMMAWGLSINWETELLRAQWIARLGPQQAAELEQGGAESPIITATAALFRPAQSEDRAGDRQAVVETASPPASEPDLPSVPGSPGSNNWVIAGARTASGKPLLANDMHLPISAPRSGTRTTWRSRAPTTGWTSPVFPSPASRTLLRGTTAVWRGASPTVLPTFRIYTSSACAGGGSGVEYEWRGEWRAAETREELSRSRGRPLPGRRSSSRDTGR